MSMPSAGQAHVQAHSPVGIADGGAMRQDVPPTSDFVILNAEHGETCMQVSAGGASTAAWGRVRADVLRVVPRPGQPSYTLRHRSDWHTLVLVLDAAGATMEFACGKQAALRPGRMDFIPAGHEFRSPIRLPQRATRGPAWLVLRLEPGLDVADPAAVLAWPVLPNLRDPALRTAVAALRSELDTPVHPNPSVLADAIGMMMIARLREVVQETEERPGRRAAVMPKWRLRRATQHAETNLADQQLSVEHMAGAAGVSTWHFIRAFKVEMGMPPHRWLLARRAARARDLLAQDRLALADVALAVGFSSQSHFTRVFRQVLGCSPGAYRRSQEAALSARKAHL